MAHRHSAWPECNRVSFTAAVVVTVVVVTVVVVLITSTGGGGCARQGLQVQEVPLREKVLRLL